MIVYIAAVMVTKAMLKNVDGVFVCTGMKISWRLGSAIFVPDEWVVKVDLTDQPIWPGG